MKVSLAIPSLVSLSLCACEVINKPLASSGEFDPMRTPGSRLTSSDAPSGPAFRPGEFATAAMDNTGFYKVKPKGDAQADKLLPRGSSMKIIEVSDTFVKVELDNGEVGFVPSVMIAPPGAATAAAGPFAANGAVQVYPPIDGSFAAPVPALPDGALPPDGVIPTVIDPNVPPPTGPLPTVTPTTDTFPVPPVNPPIGSTPAPLPPNDEDIAKQNAGQTPPAPKLEETPKPATDSAPKLEETPKPATDSAPPEPKLEGQ